MDTNFSLSDMAAACGNCNGNNQWNNPMWLIWAILFGRNGGFFGNNGEGVQAAEIQGKLNALSNQMQDNQNTNTLNAGIMGNHDYLHSFNNAVNMGFAGTNASINQASMTNALGQKDAQAQMSSCCCDIKTQMASNNAAEQLQACQNHGATMSRIDQLANGVQQGFSQIGYQNEKNTNAIIQGQQAQTQTILNTLNNHWTSELQSKYQDAKLELSQLNQNATLIAALKTT